MKSTFGVAGAWLMALGMTALVWVLALTIGNSIEVQDPTLYTRLLINRAAGTSLGLIILTGGLLFADYVLPGRWLDKIAEEPLACFGISGTILYCLTWLLTAV